MPMKLYLSSYRLGNEPEKLTQLVSGRRKVAVVRNSLDFSSDIERLRLGKEQEFGDMESIGLDPEELDLKHYFGKRNALQKYLESVDALWVVGGNAFILRKAMKLSGLDQLLTNELIGPDFVYAGYSAGACAVSLTLRGIQNVDPIDAVPKGYPSEVIWEGLGLVPFAIAPHYKSDHSESGKIEDSVAYFIDHKIPFIALRDGDVYVTEIGV